MTLNNLIPMLNVSNIEASLKLYKRALNFDVVSPMEMVQEWRWTTIRSGDTKLMLSESNCDINLKKDINPHADTSWPCIYYFYPDDVAALHTYLTQHGFQPTPLEVTDYGMREFSLQDPDGHMLSFGEDANSP